MSEANGTAPAATPETVAKAEYEALRSKHTELAGKLTDYEKVAEKVNKAGGWEKISANLEALTLLEEERAQENPNKLKEWKTTTETKIRGTIQEELNGYKTKAEQAEKKYKEVVIVDTAFSAAAGKLVKAAQDDFKALARQHGDLDEKGNLIFKNEKGEVLYKEGSTTETLDAEGFALWAMKVKPHYFASTTVSGDRDTSSTQSSGNYSNVTVEQYLNMSDKEHAQLPLAVRANLATKARQGKKV